ELPLGARLLAARRADPPGPGVGRRLPAVRAPPLDRDPLPVRSLAVRPAALRLVRPGQPPGPGVRRGVRRDPGRPRAARRGPAARAPGAARGVVESRVEPTPRGAGTRARSPGRPRRRLDSRANPDGPGRGRVR